MSKTNKKTQNNQRKGGNQNSNAKKNKQKSKQMQGKQRSGNQASVAAAYATRSEGKAPKIQASRDTCNIKHREFIGNVAGSELFQVALALSVNPGLSTTFPWLSVMAQAWEQYKFKKLRFVFLTRTGSNTPGSVIMSPDYDSSDNPPASEQIMSTYDGTVEDAPWKDNGCSLKTNLLSGAGGPRKFVRTGALSPNQDIKLYDVANMFVATVDGTAVPWGKLWVEYDVDFWVPQLPPAGLQPVGLNVAASEDINADGLLGDKRTVFVSSLVTVDDDSVISILKKGKFLVSIDAQGTGIATISASPLDGNCTSTSMSGPVVNAAATSILGIKLVTVVNTPGRIKVSSLGATTITNSRVLVSELP